jgi:hypothetical protein
MTTEERQTRSRPRRGLLRRFWRREDGAATVEFVILFPVFISLFISSFELGLYMTRQVMLDRATDLTVRALRLGQFDDPTQELLRHNICQRSAIIADCDNKLVIEMTRIPTTTWETLPTSAQCVERAEDIEELELKFDSGQPNDLMLIRVCALLRPVFPTTYLGLRMPNFGQYYALVSTAAFANEPSG